MQVASALDKGLGDFNQIVDDYPGPERFENLFEKKRELSNYAEDRKLAKRDSAVNRSIQRRKEMSYESLEAGQKLDRKHISLNSVKVGRLPNLICEVPTLRHTLMAPWTVRPLSLEKSSWSGRRVKVGHNRGTIPSKEVLTESTAMGYDLLQCHTSLFQNNQDRAKVISSTGTQAGRCVVRNGTT